MFTEYFLTNASNLGTSVFSKIRSNVYQIRNYSAPIKTIPPLHVAQLGRKIAGTNPKNIHRESNDNRHPLRGRPLFICAAESLLRVPLSLARGTVVSQTSIFRVHGIPSAIKGIPIASLPVNDSRVPINRTTDATPARWGKKEADIYMYICICTHAYIYMYRYYRTRNGGAAL